MKNYILYILLVFFSFYSKESISQIIMSNGSTSTCSDFFFDDGGSGTGSEYAQNQNLTYVICPGSGSFVAVNFFDFNLGAGDTLFIYDGNSASAPQIGVFDNSVVSPGLLASNPNNNPTGCLTFVFVSDAVDQGNGWAAEISCTPPCQNMYVQVDSIFPDTTGPDGEMDLCMGDTGYWDVSGWYTMNNTWYSQSDATTSYEWGVIQATGSFDTILNGYGSNFIIPFDSSGAFIVYVSMTDTLGCVNTQPYQQVVRVSTPPSFTNSSMSSDTICYGLTNELTPEINTTTWTNYIPPFSGDSMALPDASGSNPGVYASTMNISTFPAGQTVTSLADIDNVFMNIEHSYIGDLSITLNCPNGNSVILKAFPGGGVSWLGIPCDNGAPNTTIGVPYLYEWPVQTASALGTMNIVATGCVGCVPNTDVCTGWGGNSLPQSTYTPVTSFNNLIGCPLNGTWSLTTVDQWASDDGHLVSWGIDFNPSVLPNTVITYDPGLDSVWWTPDTPLTFVNIDTDYVATVKPTSWDTTWDYTINMTDSFGCHYDTTMSFFVRNPCDAQCLGNITPTMSQYPEACVGDNSGYAVAEPIDSISPGPYDYYWTDVNGDTISSNMGNVFSDTLFNVPSGVYNVNVVDSFGCIATNSVFVSIVPPLLGSVNNIEQTSCAGNFCDGEATGGVVSGGTSPYSYSWESGGAAQTDQNLCSGDNDLIVIDSRGCRDTVDFVVPEPDSITAQTFGEDTICISNVHTVQALGAGGNGDYSYSWSHGIGSGAQVGVSPSFTTTYEVTVTDSLNCPPAVAQLTVYVRDPLTADIAPIDTVCPGDEFYLHVETSGGDSLYSYQWSSGVNMGDSALITATSSQYIFVSVTDQCGTSPAAVDSVWMQVGGYPRIQVQSYSDTICPNEPYVLRAISSGGRKPLIYDWDNGLGTEQLEAVAPTETTVYNVTVSDACNTPSGEASITLVVDGNEFEAFVDTTENCQPGTFVFTYDTDRSGDAFYWDFGNGFNASALDTTSFTFDRVGCQDIKLKQVTALGCEFVKTYPCMVNVRRSPIADFEHDPKYPDIINAQVSFNNLSSYASSYQWYMSDTLISESSSIVRLFSDSGDFAVTLVAENEYLCTDTITKDVHVDYKTLVYLPSAFTPNNDGINDVFAPKGDGVVSYELEIFDRWGDLVFESSENEPGWDGTYIWKGREPAPIGTYIYQLKYKDVHNNTKSIRGEVQIIK